MLLSVAIIAKNEEKNIERCLSALQNLNNRIDYEIVVVDTGSNDNTINIAKRFTDKVYEHPWTGDFSEMRNISISYCTGKWIMILDADEVIESVDEIVKFFKSDESKVFNCMTLKSKNILSENENEYILMDLVRLFKNHKDFKYKGRVHEQPFLKEPIGISKITFLHYGYSRVDYNVMQYKYERNLELLLKNLEEGNKSIYNYFQIAQTYGMQNNVSEALKYIKIAYSLIGDKRDNIKSYLYVDHLYASTELKVGNYEKVIELAENAIKINNDHLDFYVMLINAYMKKAQADIASKYCDKYLELHNKINNGYIVSDISVPCNTFCRKDEIIKDKILCDYSEKQFDKIPKFFEQIKNESIKEELKEIYIYSLLKNKRYDEAYLYLREKEIEEKDIQILCNIFDKFKNEGCLEEILANIQDIVNLNDILKSIIEVIYIRKDEVNFNKGIQLHTYNIWKSKYILEFIYKNKFDIDEFKSINVNEIYQYITYLVRDYKCIAKLCEYSKEKFLTKDLATLKVVTTIEDILILNDSINGQEYDELLDRARLNKLNYINLIYDKKTIRNIDFCNLIGNNLLIWLEINDLIMFYKDDKLKVVKKLKELIKRFPQYKKLINVFLEKVNYKINVKMIEEKEKLLKASEEFICNGMFDDALEILNELNNIFKYEYEVLSLKGIALYSKGIYDKSILDLAIANSIKESDFDCIYNMACVFEAMGKLDEAKEYYKRAFNLTVDEEIKKEISQIINNF